MAHSGTDLIDEVDRARSREYFLLSRLLLQSPEQSLMNQLGLLLDDGTPIGRAHAGLSEAAPRLQPPQVAREYFEVFIGVGRGEILPYASFYLTGSLHGRPLAALRETLQGLGIERNAGMAEPEDHAGVLCEIMAGLLDGSIPSPPGASQQFLVEFLAPWMGRLFGDLEKTPAADFYAQVGSWGRALIEIELEALKLPIRAS